MIVELLLMGCFRSSSRIPIGDNINTKIGEPISNKIDEVKSLFCNICCISVTCSQQMKMHINGRKHTLKKKQSEYKKNEYLKEGKYLDLL